MNECKNTICLQNEKGKCLKTNCADTCSLKRSFDNGRKQMFEEISYKADAGVCGICEYAEEHCALHCTHELSTFKKWLKDLEKNI